MLAFQVHREHYKHHRLLLNTITFNTLYLTNVTIQWSIDNLSSMYLLGVSVLLDFCFNRLT